MPIKTAGAALLSFFVLSSCVWQDSLPENYPMITADIAAQTGDVITELSARSSYISKSGIVEIYYPKINHTAALKAFKQHIANGLPINTPDSFGLPAVAHAAAVGDTAYLSELIARGAELNYPAALNRPEPGNSCIFGENDLSATALAAQHGQTAALELLLRHGARPFGVQMAIRHDRLDCLKLLHAAGGDLHEGEYSFDGELYPNTCNARSEAVLLFLIQHGVSSKIPVRSLPSSDITSARRYIDMYLRTGVWTKAQAEQFLRTYYPKPTPVPAPLQS